MPSRNGAPNLTGGSDLQKSTFGRQAGDKTDCRGPWDREQGSNSRGSLEVDIPRLFPKQSSLANTANVDSASLLSSSWSSSPNQHRRVRGYPRGNRREGEENRSRSILLTELVFLLLNCIRSCPRSGFFEKQIRESNCHGGTQVEQMPYVPHRRPPNRVSSMRGKNANVFRSSFGRTRRSRESISITLLPILQQSAIGSLWKLQREVVHRRRRSHLRRFIFVNTF